MNIKHLIKPVAVLALFCGAPVLQAQILAAARLVADLGVRWAARSAAAWGRRRHGPGQREQHTWRDSRAERNAESSCVRRGRAHAPHHGRHVRDRLGTTHTNAAGSIAGDAAGNAGGSLSGISGAGNGAANGDAAGNLTGSLGSVKDAAPSAPSATPPATTAPRSLASPVNASVNANGNANANAGASASAKPSAVDRQKKSGGTARPRRFHFQLCSSAYQFSFAAAAAGDARRA